MASSGAHKETARSGVRPSATGPPPHVYPGALPRSVANPSAPLHFYPGAPMSSSPLNDSSANPMFNQWRPMYTPAPEGLVSFAPFLPMPPYNIQSLENLHFVGGSPQESFSTPPPPPHPKVASGSAAAKVDSSSSKKKRKILSVADDEPNERTAQRLAYTPDEHVRLASAWLECSNDPINVNGKTGEKFWDEIAALYNSTTPSNRKRDRNQLKQEWHRTKKRLGAFHGAWNTINGFYKSGYKPEDLEQMALEKYQSDNGHAFPHLTMWVKLREEGKWLACYRKMQDNDGKSPSAGADVTSNVIDLEGEKRPPGRGKPKTEGAGKGKAGGISQELGERLDKFIQVSNQSIEDRQKVIDSQALLSDRQLETAKINNKTKMLDAYTKMLLADTSRMDEGEKARRAKALSGMEAMLFPEGDSGEH